MSEVLDSQSTVTFSITSFLSGEGIKCPAHDSPVSHEKPGLAQAAVVEDMLSIAPLQFRHHLGPFLLS